MGKLFSEAIKKNEFLIMDHRGFWGGNIIQNTRQASSLSYKAGADIVEIDICRTKDGEYYLFHDGNEEFLLGENKHFTEWTSKEIDATTVINTALEPSGYHLEKLADYLDWLPEGKLINVDRAWFFFEDPKFFEILINSDKIDQIFLKSPAEEVYLKKLNELALQIPYMPIVKKKEDFETILKYSNILTIGLEVIALSESHELFDRDWIENLRSEGYLVLANSIHLGEELPLFADLTDDKAITEPASDAWGQIIEMGVNVIQTDWPNFLSEYREKRMESK